MFAPRWVSCLLFTSHSKKGSSYISTCHFSLSFESEMNCNGLKAGGLGSCSRKRCLGVIRLWGESALWVSSLFVARHSKNGNNYLSTCLLFLFLESVMDQIELEARGLGSCSGYRILGLTRFWRRAPPWVLCLFFTSHSKKGNNFLSICHLFSFFPSESRSTHPSESWSTISYVASCSSFLENIPILQANRESNDRLLEHTSVDCRFPLEHQKRNATMSELKVNVHKCYLYKIYVTLIYIFSPCTPQNELSKSDQNVSNKFRWVVLWQVNMHKCYL